MPTPSQDGKRPRREKAGARMPEALAEEKGKGSVKRRAPAKRSKTHSARGFSAKRSTERGLEYLVDWVGWVGPDGETSTWEPADLYTSPEFDEWKLALGALG